MGGYGGYFPGSNGTNGRTNGGFNSAGQYGAYSDNNPQVQDDYSTSKGHSQSQGQGQSGVRNQYNKARLRGAEQVEAALAQMGGLFSQVATLVRVLYPMSYVSCLVSNVLYIFVLFIFYPNPS